MTLNDFKSVEGDRLTGIRSLPVHARRRPRGAARLRGHGGAAGRGHRAAARLGRAALGGRGRCVLLAAQLALMPRLLRAPREQAPLVQRPPARRSTCSACWSPPSRCAAAHVRDETMTGTEIFDAVVVGGGPAGATAAADLARQGRRVLLLDRAGRIKPCGGAIPPRLVREFAIPDHLLVARANARPHRLARRQAGATCRSTAATSAWSIARSSTSGCASARPLPAPRGAQGSFDARQPRRRRRRAWCIYGRRRRRSRAAACAPAPSSARTAPSRPSPASASRAPTAIRYVFAYHEIVRAPAATTRRSTRLALRHLLPGPALAGFLRLDLPARRHDERRHRVGAEGVRPAPRRDAGCAKRPGSTGLETIRREGAPIPLRPMKRWDNGRDVVLAGDAAGRGRARIRRGHLLRHARRPAGGRGGRADCSPPATCARSRTARKRFMKAHGRVFMVLGIMQWFWYTSDKRRETLRQDLPRPGRPAAHLGSLHEQEDVPPRPDGASCASSSRTWRTCSGWPARDAAAARLGRRPVAAALLVALLGGAATDDRAVVLRPAQAVLAAAGLAVRPGLDADLCADRARRRARLEPAAAPRSAAAHARAVRAQRAAERAVERAVLSLHAAGLGVDRGGAVLALDPGADGRALADLARRELGCWRRTWSGLRSPDC